MPPSFLIVNNGLKDLAGHYFETAVSVAEAARDLGLRPVLTAHRTCPADIVPSWLAFLPAFRTDHWMGYDPGPSAPLTGVCPSFHGMVSSPGDGLRTATTPFRAYLAARLGLHIGAASDPCAAPPPVAESPPSRRQKARDTAQRCLPPALLTASRSAWRGAKRAARLAIPPAAWDRSCPPPKPASPPNPAADPPPRDPLLAALDRVHQGLEWPWFEAFRDDLDAVLAYCGVGPGDHVFFPTAHGRELAALLRVIEHVPLDLLPTFHLEFRHALDTTVGGGGSLTDHPYVTCHRVFFDFARWQPRNPRVRLYTDTPELAEEHSRFSGLPFGVLPIPFRAHLLSAHRWEPGQPVCLGYFGDVRDEKGFGFLPAAVRACREDLDAGRVGFLIQARAVPGEHHPASAAAMAELRRMNHPGVRLVGTDQPLPPADYYSLFASADVLLCPYDAAAYRRRSSGILTEAAVAGIPTVVPAGTWLASQQPPGGGEQFDSPGAFPAAVRRVVADYPRYLAAAADHREWWLRTHTPANLVRALIG